MVPTAIVASVAPSLGQTSLVLLNDAALTAFGVVALTFMMLMYGFERRHRGFVVAFAVGCLLSSAYGFLSGAWPFGVVELIWAGLALQRYAAGSKSSGS